jgi:hypothetical protein
MKIAFYTPHLCLRGTTTAIHDYAKYNQEILGNESIVFYDSSNEYNHETVITKFNNICQITGISGNRDMKNLDMALAKEKCDAVYVIKKGYKSDGMLPAACKSLIHVIAPVPASEKHGDVWCYASNWLKNSCAPNENVPVVPYMVDLPHSVDDMRKEYNIPNDALVFGRNGGLDTWNLSFANDVILSAINARPDVYFMFQNTNIPFEHERIKHIPSSGDMNLKTRFINSCDAMIHARQEGESFGLSCAEFSIRDKPVITWSMSSERSHIEILGDKAHLYTTPQQMFEQIVNFTRKWDYYNCYNDYTPERVMKNFNEIFINGN